MSQVTHIHAERAQEARNSLLQALGTENNPAQWMLFMEAVELHLPLMASAGRPTQKEIQASVIGQLGFKSWREMLEAPVSDNGLGWSYNSWKAWLKAWNVIKQAPYLREEPLTASAINKLNKDFEMFPETSKEFQELQEAKAEEKERMASETLSALKNRVSEQEQELLAKEAKIAMLADMNKDLNEQLSELKNRKVGRLEHFWKIFTG